MLAKPASQARTLQHTRLSPQGCYLALPGRSCSDHHPLYRPSQAVWPHFSRAAELKVARLDKQVRLPPWMTTKDSHLMWPVAAQPAPFSLAPLQTSCGLCSYLKPWRTVGCWADSSPAPSEPLPRAQARAQAGHGWSEGWSGRGPEAALPCTVLQPVQSYAEWAGSESKGQMQTHTEPLGVRLSPQNVFCILFTDCHAGASHLDPQG